MFQTLRTVAAERLGEYSTDVFSPERANLRVDETYRIRVFARRSGAEFTISRATCRAALDEIRYESLRPSLESLHVPHELL